MKKGRILSMLLSLALSASMLSGCGADDNKSSADDSKDNSETASVENGSSEGGDESEADLGDATVLTENIVGEEDGYGYELWKDNGDTTMVLTGDGTFTCEWSNINNALFRRGQKFDCTQGYQDLGNIKVDYDVDYNPEGNSYLCVYGWTRDPLVEYYVVESWGSWRPPGAAPIGTVTADGGEYDVYKTIRVEQPSIDGTATFEQYWSVRREKRTSGTINVSAHFAAWESMGMPMGNMYEVALTVEGYQSSGSAKVLKNELTIGGELVAPDNAELFAPPEPEEADEDGYFFRSTFEDGTDGWGPRGDSTVETTGSAAAEGSKAILVSGRHEAWNGVGHDLSASTYVPGTAYSFSVMAMQDEEDSADFKLTLQYDADGVTHYDGIAELAGAKGEWIQLANNSFVIPEGATNLLLYVETVTGTINFYIDAAAVAVEGVEIAPSV